MVRTVVKKRYRHVFESLMDYTDFKDSSEIKTKQDLFKFFEQVEKDARSKGKNFRTSKSLYNAIANEVIIGVQTGRTVVNPTQQAVKSESTFRSVKSAQESNLLVNYKGKKIFKSSYSRKGKQVIKWRDTTGRFTSKPKTEEN